MPKTQKQPREEIKKHVKKLIHYQNVDEMLDVVFGLQVYQGLILNWKRPEDSFKALNSSSTFLRCDNILRLLNKLQRLCFQAIN